MNRLQSTVTVNRVSKGKDGNSLRGYFTGDGLILENIGLDDSQFSRLEALQGRQIIAVFEVRPMLGVDGFKQSRTMVYPTSLVSFTEIGGSIPAASVSGSPASGK